MSGSTLRIYSITATDVSSADFLRAASFSYFCHGEAFSSASSSLSNPLMSPMPAIAILYAASGVFPSEIRSLYLSSRF